MVAPARRLNCNPIGTKLARKKAFAASFRALSALFHTIRGGVRSGDRPGDRLDNRYMIGFNLCPSAMSSRLKTPTLEHATAVLTLAFSADPPSRWVFPDPHEYVTYFPEFVRAFGGRAFEHNTADSLEGCAAVALWLPPGIKPDEEAMIGLMQRTVSESVRADAFAIFEQMSGFHPREAHWYLPLIGVDPARQGAGYGTELMKHALQRCDADRKLAYLESSNPRNTPLYERFGFERLGVIQAGAFPQIVPMLRKPR